MKKNSVWILLFFIMIAFLAFPANGQTLKRQSIGAYGSGGAADNIRVSQTIGQPYFTGTSNLNESGLHPGFIQSFLFKGYNSPLDQISLSKEEDFDDVLVYPNPASVKINIVKMEELEKASLQIANLNGRKMLDEKVSDFSSYRVNCINWPEGYYLISIFDENSNASFTTKVLITK